MSDHNESGNAKEASIPMMDSLMCDVDDHVMSPSKEEIEENDDEEDSYIYDDGDDDDINNNSNNSNNSDYDYIAVSNKHTNNVSLQDDPPVTKLPPPPPSAAIVSSTAPILDLSMHDIPTVSHKDSEDKTQDDVDSRHIDDDDDDDDDDSYQYEDSDDGSYPTATIDNHQEDDPLNTTTSTTATAARELKADKALEDANQLALKIQSLHDTLQQDIANVNTDLNIQPLRLIDLIVLAHRMIEMRQQFKAAGVDCTIDIGYHYTRPENMDNIKDDGLLTKSDRDTRGRTARFNGAAYGDGVYTCDNCTATTGYGAVGLMVARLKGNCTNFERGQYVQGTQHNIYQRVQDDPDIHTVIVQSAKYVILRKSAQCCPLVRYNTAAVAASSAIIDNYHWELRVLLNQFCNPASKSVAKLISGDPGFDCPGLPKQFLEVPDMLVYTAPDSIKPYIPSDLLQPVSNTDHNTNYRCGICKQGENGMQFVMVECCNTKFHSPCITNYLNSNNLGCIGCNKNVRLNIGLMPSAQMRVDRISRGLLTSDNIGASHCLQIMYIIQQGIENQYHPWPGRKIWRTTKIGYIPDSTDMGGVNILLARLKYAFLNGHSLQILPEPRTMGSIVWGPIPHSSSIMQWCDEQSISNMNRALDKLGVPSFFLEE